MERKHIDADAALREVARKNHITVDEVRKEIRLAMIAAMCDPDPAIQRVWREIPCAAAISLRFDHDGNQVVSHHLHFHRHYLLGRWVLYIIAADEHARVLVLIAAAQRTHIHVLV